MFFLVLDEIQGLSPSLSGDLIILNYQIPSSFLHNSKSLLLCATADVGEISTSPETTFSTVDV